MRLSVRPFDPVAALPVFRLMDPNDHIEAELVRGRAANGIELWADWRAAEAFRVLSFMACEGSTPFAVFALMNTGQAGVAGAALLARPHVRFRGAIARLAVMIRVQLPIEAAARGIHRIEARCWGDHPTAARLLTNLGFAHECDMPGFGPDGRATYRQFAWTNPTPKGD